jgi:transposase
MFEHLVKTQNRQSISFAVTNCLLTIRHSYKKGRDFRIKRVLRQRMFFVRVRTMVKNRVQALLSQHSIQRPEVSDLFGVAGLKWLKGLTLPEPDQGLLQEQIKLFRVLQARIRTTEGLIGKLSMGDPAVGWLGSVPGIGAFFSVLIRYEVDEIKRFRSAKKFTSYTGLVPSTYASGSRTIHGRLTKQGNKWLRWAFVEAVSPAIRYSPWLRRYYLGIKARRGTKDARTATARKLVELVWSVWTEGRMYEDRVS